MIRQASSAIFGRIKRRGEAQQWFPAATFAHRQELSPQLVGIMARWLLAHWALTCPVWVVDWDESNAFCNVPREGLRKLLESYPVVDCGEWLARFYASLDV